MPNFAKNTVAVTLFQKAFKLVGWIQNLPNKVTPPPIRLMQIGSLFWQSRVLYVAVKLDIATHLRDQALPVSELATLTDCHADSLYRLLRMLISMGIFTETKPGVIANNQMSVFLDDAHPQSARAMILMHNSVEMSKPWIEELENAIHSGEIPFKLAHGEDLFNYMDSHTEFGNLFSKAMDTTEAIIGDAFLNDFNWGNYERIIDVGGSKGSKSISILKKFPNLKAVVFDRSQVIEKARQHWQGKVDESVLARIEFVSGDARESVPAANSDKDAYLLCALLHGLADDDSVKVLQNIKQASQPHKADVILIDAVLAEMKESLMLTSFDMQMFMGTEGRERTANEWGRICERSGYQPGQAIDSRSLWKVLRLCAG